MKFKMNFGLFKSAILIIILLGALAIVGLDISMLVKAANGGAVRIAVASVSLVAAIIISLLCILVLFNSFYKFNTELFVITLGFISDKIKKEDIISLMQNTNSKEVFILTKGIKENDSDYKLKVNIKKDLSEKFVEEFRKYYPSILIELINDDELNK